MKNYVIKLKDRDVFIFEADWFEVYEMLKLYRDGEICAAHSIENVLFIVEQTLYSDQEIIEQILQK